MGNKREFFLSRRPVCNRERKKVGTGLGFVYDVELAQIFLDSRKGFEFTDILTDEARAFFQRTIETPERISAEQGESEVVYEGDWVYQGSEPTCLPWAVANASVALGLEPDAFYIADLLNYAIDIKESINEGANYPKAMELLAKYPKSSISLVGLPYEDRLALIHEPPSEDRGEFLYKLYKIDDVRSSKQIKEDAEIVYKNAASEVVKRNGAVIKKVLDEGGVLLTSVLIKKYAGEKKGGLHAICIVGYKVSEAGIIDIQIVDAARGRIWMSLEHLSSSVVPFMTYKMTKEIKFFQK